ncbi:MAG: DUF5721 family protein [Lachnospiraceae bacterium]|jgi:hypothetical protein
MKAIEINDIKKFTSALFVGKTFDTFCVTEASFSTLINIRIDGRVNREFLTGEKEPEVAEGGNYLEGDGEKNEPVKWENIKSLCYNIIAGKRLPLKFKIVFMVPPEKMGNLIEREGLDISARSVNAMFLNIRFENKKLTCTTGISLKEFTLDKSLENAWDNSMEKFLERFV